MPCCAELLDHILVIDHGRVVLDAPADDLGDAGAVVTGPAGRVDRFIAGRPDAEPAHHGRARHGGDGRSAGRTRPRARGSPPAPPRPGHAPAAGGLRRREPRPPGPDGKGDDQVKSTPFVMIARYLLLDRLTYLVLPWAWAAFGFVLDVVIVQLTPAGHTSHRWVGGLAGVFIVVIFGAAQLSVL